MENQTIVGGTHQDTSKSILPENNQPLQEAQPIQAVSTKPISQIEYEKFMAEYKSSLVGAEAVGSLIARMGQYFGDANREYGAALQAYDKMAAIIEQSQDDNGKTISSTKAKILSAASTDGLKLSEKKIEVETIDKQIMCLQSLQKGIINEFGHTANMG